MSAIGNAYARRHYDDYDLMRTMQFVRHINAENLAACIRDAVSEDVDPDMGNYVVHVIEQIDRHEITDPYDAAMHMFTALVGWDFNTLAECSQSE